MRVRERESWREKEKINMSGGVVRGGTLGWSAPG